MGARWTTGLTEGYRENVENSFSWPLLSWQSYVSVTTAKLYMFIETREGHKIKKKKNYTSPFVSQILKESIVLSDKLF